MKKSARKLLFCFHDFSVENAESSLKEILFLKELMGRVFSVLVIPSVENAPKEKVECFKKGLKFLEGEGFELVLHGCYHRAFQLPKTFFGQVAHRATGGEAEFVGLSASETGELLEKALAAWNALALQAPLAFVPPTWHANKHLIDEVLSRKMLCETRFFLHFKSNSPLKKRVFSPVISFAGLPQKLLPLSFWVAHLLLKLPGTLRIALHPSDFITHKNEIFRLTKKAALYRESVYYKEILEK